MASGQECCAPCPTVQTVNVPGAPGADGQAGNDGADGINSFTTSTANFVVPNVGDQVTVLVADSSWMTTGQPVFVEGAGAFQVVSKPGTSSVVLEYLDYAGNTHTGETIATGAQISPSGTQPDVTLLPAINDYHVAGSQALTNSSVALLSTTVTLTTPGTYLLTASARLDFDNATTVANQTVTLKLRETNNGPADVADAVRGIATGVVTTQTHTLAATDLPQVTYTAAAGDVIELFGLIDSVPYIGDVNVVETSILAIRLF